MAQYIFLDDDWINVDKILRVHVLKDKKTAEASQVVVYFQGGESHKFRGDSALELLAYLEKSRVQ